MKSQCIVCGRMLPEVEPLNSHITIAEVCDKCKDVFEGRTQRVIVDVHVTVHRGCDEVPITFIQN
jgi:hypothetical protein